jgi:inner membrane protein
MATLLTHAIVGATLGQAAAADLRRKPAFWFAAVLCAVLPDVDVIGFSFGVQYGDLWGHRGMTHSLLFALLVAMCLAVRLQEGTRQRVKLAVLLFVITASHGLLDALTNGGLGVAFFSPFDTRRYFFPWRPILVSPIGVRGLLSARAMRVLWSEIPWIWAPALVVSATIWGLRTRHERPVATESNL